MAASRTAAYVAFYRALETARPKPLFRDPFASAFLPRSLALAVQASRTPVVRGALTRYADFRAPGARTSAIGRTCFIDDVVRRRAREGLRQLVILGAGFDCRAHRMPELERWRVFEVDRPETQAQKRARVPASDRVQYVAVDFLRDDVAARLREAGWDVSSPSLFVWEGVTNYLTEAAVSEVLAWIGRAAAGSTLVFTYIHRGLLDGSTRFRGGEKMMQNVRALGEPWRFGLEPREVAPFVARFGLSLEEDLGADEYRRRYLGPRAQRGYGFYRIAVATVQNAARPILTDQARD